MKLPTNSPVNILIIAMLSLVLSSSTGIAQSKEQKIDELLQLYHEYGKFNGSVLVADAGKVIYKKGIGLANMEWDIPNAPDTKHRIGSITKQFTAMLILQLAADAKLDLHQPISKYLAEYPQQTGDKITCHHLLSHTSGIPNYTNAPGYLSELSRNAVLPQRFVEDFQDLELEFEPGERFAYSNSGYYLLGLIIEEVSGKSYEEMLKEKIFAPLGMNDTGYDWHSPLIPKRAGGYEKGAGGFVNAGFLDMSVAYAAGAMYSTVEDLYKWDRALYTNQLLPEKYMNLFFEPAIPAFADFYAYGWVIAQEAIGTSTDSLSIIWHNGGINGFNSHLSRSTDDQSLIVLLNNTGPAPLAPINRAILGILEDKSYDLPKPSLAFYLLDKIQKDGIEAGLQYFERNKDSESLDLQEQEMNQIGYQLMGQDNIEEAAEVFKLNVDAFPNSANVYDSYAEALMNLGQNDAAIENYRTSVKMNPANQNAIAMLKKLGEDTSDLEKEVLVSEEILQSYVGRYELAPGFNLSVSREGSQLKVQATGQQMHDIFPKSESEFYYKLVEAQIAFNCDEQGKITSLTLFQNGKEIPGKRLED